MRTVTLPVVPAIVDMIGHLFPRVSPGRPGPQKSAFHLDTSENSMHGDPVPPCENASMCPSPPADEPSSGPYQPYRADSLLVEHDGPVTVVTINRPERSNAVDSVCADQLRAAFLAFDGDEERSVAVLAGAGRTFCAG